MQTALAAFSLTMCPGVWQELGHMRGTFMSSRDSDVEQQSYRTSETGFGGIKDHHQTRPGLCCRWSCH